MRKNKTGHKGFTLLEVLLVVAIISVLAGFTFPLARKSIKLARFRACADKVYLFLDYAKTQAVVKAEVLEAEFDSESNEMFLMKRQDSGKQESLFKMVFSDDIKVKLEPNKVVFYPDGTMEEFEITVFSPKRSAVFFSRGFDGRITRESDS